MRAPFVVLLGLAEGVLLTNAMIACAYRCDPQWPGLDTGRCLANSESCPDPMDKAVTDDICWGLPFQPGPGDILFHDAIPFDDSNDCQGYIDAWENKDALERRRLHYALQVKTTREIYFGNRSQANLTFEGANNEDKVSASDRGKTWGGVLKGVLSKCVGIGGKAVDSCKSWDEILKQGMNGGQVRDCLQDCAAMEGISLLEDAACNYAFSETGPAAKLICQGVSKILSPVNKAIDKYVVQPVIKVADKVEDAVASAGRAIGHFFHFW